MWWPGKDSAAAREKEMEQLGHVQDLSKLLRDDRKTGCLSCDIMGGSAFIGLGVYSYFSGHRQLQLQREKILRSNSMIGMKGRQAGITGIAFSLVSLGLYRWVN